MSDSATSSDPKGSASPDAGLWRFLTPRFWPVWIGLGVLRLLVLLPYRVQMSFGRGLGRLVRCFALRERHISAVNLRLALPELSDGERARLLRRHFESLGCALFETALAWWASDKRLRALIVIDGLDRLERVLERGRGAILLSAHFTTLEIGARALAMHTSTAIMYQTPKNALIAALSMRLRGKHTARTICSDNVRGLFGSLKRNLPVWYAPDQREHGESALLVPFFGVPATTNVATSRIAAISGAAVLPYFVERLADGSGYSARIGAPLEGFPSGDASADAARFHVLLEEQVRRCPEQYLWSYKRFKRLGPGGDPYRSAADE